MRRDLWANLAPDRVRRHTRRVAGNTPPRWPRRFPLECFCEHCFSEPSLAQFLS